MSLYGGIPTAEIRKNIWISSELAGRHSDRVKDNNIKVVIVMKHEDLFVNKVEGVEYHLITVWDGADDILMRFYWTNKIIDEALAEDKAVMVISSFGRSRSVAPVIAYLMKTEKLTYEQAYNECRQKRNYIDLSPEVHAQLALYEVMKCDANMNNIWMKRHFLRQMFRVKNFPDYAYDIPNFIEYAKKNFVPQNPKPDPESMYQCKACEYPLFAIDDVLGVYKWEWSSSNRCIAISTVATEWMIMDDQYVDGSEGIIKCPGCQLEIGEFIWSYAKCEQFSYIVNFRGKRIFDIKVPCVFQFEKSSIIIPIHFL